MSVAIDTAKSISWFAIFKSISQTFSWAVTIILARILVPVDYALMDMATIFTGYAALFSELGLGAAIVQKENLDNDELSSIFWLGLIFSSLFGISCFILAYPTAMVFSQERLIPLTQTVSIIFFLNGLVIVPANILRKQMQFKKIGIIETAGIIVSSAFMVIIAHLGGGVWTFIWGHIIRDFIKTILYYRIARWWPSFHFSFFVAKQYLQFGLAISLGNSFKYVSEKSDRFFAGMSWNAQALGYYSFALTISGIVNEKIKSIVNQVSFSAFSKLQNEKEKFNSLYLQLTRVIFSMVMPLYLGGFWCANELFTVIFGSKWDNAVFFFKALCIVQIFKALAPLNYQVHATQGRVRLYLYLHAFRGLLLAATFFLTIRYFGKHGIILPWFTSFVIFLVILIYTALKRLNISAGTYILNLIHPLCASVMMSLALFGLKMYISAPEASNFNLVFILLLKILIGSVVYIGYLLIVDKQLILNIRKLRPAKSPV